MIVSVLKIKPILPETVDGISKALINDSNRVLINFEERKKQPVRGNEKGLESFLSAMRVDSGISRF